MARAQETCFQVLHLLAMARAADIHLTIDDFQEVANRTPFLADLKYVVINVQANPRVLSLMFGL